LHKNQSFSDAHRAADDAHAPHAEDGRHGEQTTPIEAGKEEQEVRRTAKARAKTASYATRSALDVATIRTGDLGGALSAVVVGLNLKACVSERVGGKRAADLIFDRFFDSQRTEALGLDDALVHEHIGLAAR
jgi:hypothetical protein